VTLGVFTLLSVGCSKGSSAAIDNPTEKAPAVESKRVGKPGSDAEPKAASGPILMVVAQEGYRDEELSVPRDAFEKAGFSIVVASSVAGEAKGALGGSTKVDVAIKDVTPKVKDYSAVVFVGGPGSAVLHKDKDAHDLARAAVKEKRVVGAICLGPFILAYAGVLGGVSATVWTGGKFTPEEFAKQGPLYRKGPVVTDGLFVTGDGPGASAEFADAILKLLK